MQIVELDHTHDKERVEKQRKLKKITAGKDKTALKSRKSSSMKEDVVSNTTTATKSAEPSDNESPKAHCSVTNKIQATPAPVSSSKGGEGGEKEDEGKYEGKYEGKEEGEGGSRAASPSAPSSSSNKTGSTSSSNGCIDQPTDAAKKKSSTKRQYIEGDRGDDHKRLKPKNNGNKHRQDIQSDWDSGSSSGYLHTISKPS